MKSILDGKKAIITGSSQGLGLEIARKFVLSGADIMMCARDGKTLERAKDDLKKITNKKQKILSLVNLQDRLHL